VPLVVGEQARGLINLVDMEREHAYGESDVRLLQTLANSMSVALENARLFDETQRLFKESEQRAAELAIINSVQQALAAELNVQGIYDAVGDKIRELFVDSDMSIRTHDPRDEPHPLPVRVREGEANPHRVAPPRQDRLRGARAAHARDDRHQPEHGRRNREDRQQAPARDRAREVGDFRPVVASDQARGRDRAGNLEREDAYGPSDVRLLQTLATSMSVALENARLFAETQRRTRETAALVEVGRDVSRRRSTSPR
jgi:GAF domain-containing protein